MPAGSISGTDVDSTTDTLSTKLAVSSDPERSLNLSVVDVESAVNMKVCSPQSMVEEGAAAVRVASTSRDAPVTETWIEASGAKSAPTKNDNAYDVDGVVAKACEMVA